MQCMKVAIRVMQVTIQFPKRLDRRRISGRIPSCWEWPGQKIRSSLYERRGQDWPDILDLNTRQFIYYGDNKTPGHELHDTGPGGNRILRRVFDLLHSSPPSRSQIPPFFIFKKYPTLSAARTVQFKGLAVPGFSVLPSTSDLFAVWKTSKGQRFQNCPSPKLPLPIMPSLPQILERRRLQNSGLFRPASSVLAPTAPLEVPSGLAEARRHSGRVRSLERMA